VISAFHAFRYGFLPYSNGGKRRLPSIREELHDHGKRVSVSMILGPKMASVLPGIRLVEVVRGFFEGRRIPLGHAVISPTLSINHWLTPLDRSAPYVSARHGKLLASCGGGRNLPYNTNGAWPDWERLTPSEAFTACINSRAPEAHGMLSHQDHYQGPRDGVMRLTAKPSPVCRPGLWTETDTSYFSRPTTMRPTDGK
jgi:hypothetical protein